MIYKGNQLVQRISIKSSPCIFSIANQEVVFSKDAYRGIKSSKLFSHEIWSKIFLWFKQNILTSLWTIKYLSGR